jgi:hypothetical protein
LIQAIPEAADNDNGGRVPVDGVSKGKLEVGLVLVSGMLDKRGAQGNEAGARGGVKGVEIPDHDGWGQAEGQRVTRAAIGAHEEIIGPCKAARPIDIRDQPIRKDEDSW